PIYWTIASSVTPSDDFSPRPLNFLPQHFTLDHYSRLLGINIARIGGVEVFKQFRAALLNSVVTSIAATQLCVAISSLGAYAFTRLQFPGRKVLL
ncbi:carbohydrate ABC transporter permease, partial [Rhizobium ruizarguesonis]